MNSVEAESQRVIQQTILRLRYWRQGGTNFTSHLFDLMQKSDEANLARLSKGFPVEVSAFIAWRAAPSELDFFRVHGMRGGVLAMARELTAKAVTDVLSMAMVMGSAEAWVYGVMQGVGACILSLDPEQLERICAHLKVRVVQLGGSNGS